MKLDGRKSWKYESIVNDMYLHKYLDALSISTYLYHNYRYPSIESNKDEKIDDRQPISYQKCDM